MKQWQKPVEINYAAPNELVDYQAPTISYVGNVSIMSCLQTPLQMTCIGHQHADMSQKIQECWADKSSNSVSWTMENDMPCCVSKMSANMLDDSFGHKKKVHMYRTKQMISNRMKQSKVIRN